MPSNVQGLPHYLFKIMIPFNKPFFSGGEFKNISLAYEKGHLSGCGYFTEHCEEWLRKKLFASGALLTHSCTAALEMSAILLNITPGDEVILPSYTFVSTANAFVLRGAIPVYVDIRSDTLNINEELIEGAITSRTKAIVPVHYAGVACEMDSILRLAEKYGLSIIEDAAQGILSRYKGRPLGSIGQMGTLSFHETKNIISGEGGALLLSDPSLIERAEVIREKGTNRRQFFHGQTDKYTWQGIGSSYPPSELIAAVLSAQLINAEDITISRREIWNKYHTGLVDLELNGYLRRPIIPDECEHNGHMYYCLARNNVERNQLLEFMRQMGVNCTFHYVPLHTSPFGRRFYRPQNSLGITENISGRLIRLPVWLGVEKYQEYILKSIKSFFDDKEK